MFYSGFCYNISFFITEFLVLSVESLSIKNEIALRWPFQRTEREDSLAASWWLSPTFPVLSLANQPTFGPPISI